MAVEGVGLEVHLAVEGDDLAALGEDKRVDLDDGAVEVDVHLVQLLHEVDGAVDRLALEAEAKGERAGLERGHAEERSDGLAENLLRAVLCNLFDVHAAF